MDSPEVQRWVTAGRVALLRDDARGAIGPLRRALTEDPEHAVAHLLLATALLRLKRPSAALVEANAAMLGDPESSEAHVVLGDVLFASRDVRAAERHYEAAREFGTHRAGPLRGLAAVASFYDDEDRAVALLREALTLGPDDVKTLVALARTSLLRGALDDAERYATEALEAEPEHLDALVVRGLIHVRRGEIADAREHAVWALRRDPTDLGAIELLAAVKARESLALGVWYRANARLATLGKQATTLLVAMFVVQALLRLVLVDLGLPRAAAFAQWVWWGLCGYSYIAPAVFRRMIQKEIAGVGLKSDY